MAINQQLDQLESQGLIRLSQAMPELEYLFRHALVQDAAYASLLRQDRKRLHQAVGDVLEQDFADRLDELAPVLGQHFAEAGDSVRAVRYFGIAGDQATRRYAIQEAVAHYSRALEAARQSSVMISVAPLHRSRGLAYEALGDFERARADYEAEWQVAKRGDNRQAELQALLDLGMLWAASDYNQTGNYYQQAYELAQVLDDPRSMARSLNHLGNWQINIDQAVQAIEYHRKALAIFEELHDKEGIAETLDFLGMANALGGDHYQATVCFEQAIALFRQLDNRSGLTSSLAIMGLRGATYQTNVIPLVANLDESTRHAQMSLAIALESGSRPAEAFAKIILAEVFGSQGIYDRAFEYVQSSQAIAVEIQHRQWMTFAHCVLGMLYEDILALAEARQHLERGLDLAKSLGSWHWIRLISGSLASVCVAQHDLTATQAILDFALTPGIPARSIGQRLAWCGYAELELARGQYGAALRITDNLVQMSQSRIPGAPSLRISLLRGEAFAGMGEPVKAEADLLVAQDLAIGQGARPMHWRILAALASLYQQQGRLADAAAVQKKGTDMVNELAASVPDEALRGQFLEQAVRQLSQPEGVIPASPAE